MATKSFLKNVNLRDTRQCQAFIKALEKSQSKEPKQVDVSTPVRDLNKEQIRKIFGGAQ